MSDLDKPLVQRLLDFSPYQNPYYSQEAMREAASHIEAQEARIQELEAVYDLMEGSPLVEVGSEDVRLLEGAVNLFNELATGENTAPLSVAQAISRVAKSLRAAGGLHNPHDAETLAAVALSAVHGVEIVGGARK